MKDVMKNRGPDQQGSFNYSNNNYILNLFSSRLKIIDLRDRANQPFKTEKTILIFNGEIYNYLELKNFLQKKNIKFLTNSDTEVLIKSYEFWGEDCVNHFDGMWSFCIYDYLKEKVFLSRDNFGEKPLYYHFNNNEFLFGSEIKYIQTLSSNKNLRDINLNKINNYIYCGYKSLNKNYDTFFKKINEVEQGSNIIINLKNFRITKKKYLNKSYLSKQKVSKDINENIFEIKKLLIESLNLRLRSDVPISFCLSGGVDSSSLVSICYKILGIKAKCYSIVDSDKRYNEKKNIKILQKDLNCDIDFINLKKEKYENFFENLKKLISYHDAPISTISYYIHSKISQKSSESGYKVIFSGTGADEIFTGYYDHFLMFLNEIKKKKQYKIELNHWHKFVKPFIRNEDLQNEKLFNINESFRDHIFNDRIFTNKFLKKKNYAFTEKKYNKNLLKNRMLNELFHESVPIILKHDDLNSMLFSIENRSPFLSKKLVSYALSIKNQNYIHNGYSKYILRSATKNILHDDIRLDRHKRGFNSNLKSITSFNIHDLYDFLSSSTELKELINYQNFKKINLNNEISNSMSKFIFALINTKLFIDLNCA